MVMQENDVISFTRVCCFVTFSDEKHKQIIHEPLCSCKGSRGKLGVRNPVKVADCGAYTVRSSAI